MEQECRAKGYRLKTLQIYEKTDDVKRYLEDLRVNGCVGIILLGTEITASICNDFLALNIPMILLDSYFDSVSCSSVIINNSQGAYLATNYLIDRLGKQPGHLCSSYKIENFTERKNGFQRAVREHGKMCIRDSIWLLMGKPQQLSQEMVDMLKRNSYPFMHYERKHDTSLLTLSLIHI